MLQIVPIFQKTKNKGNLILNFRIHHESKVHLTICFLKINRDYLLLLSIYMRNEMVLINFEQTSTDLNGSGSMGLRFKLELLKYHSEHEFDLATTLLSRL